MADTQLLERAARAVGYTHYVDSFGVHQVEHGRWNPLTDDADAFRLMVSLGISVSTPDDGDMVASATHWSLTQFYAEKVVNNDPYAATRRAIVRTAAAMSNIK